jgi:hypothetical protein
MKVHELVEILLKMPREADIYLFGDCAPAQRVQLHEITDDCPAHVSIEGCD